MKRKMTYSWRLREVMAAHNLWKTTDLVPLLAERGVHLSPAQVYRLVVHPPERLSMVTLAALCDIFDIAPNDLIEVSADVMPKNVAAITSLGHGNSKLRPRRARIVDEE